MKRRTFLGLAAFAATLRSSRTAASGVSTSGRPETAGSERPAPPTAGVTGRVAVATYRRPSDRFFGGLDAALGGLTGLSGAESWSRLFGPGDRVAIKLNCLAAPRLSPRRELVEALIEGIESAGVTPSSIVVFERTSRELEKAGYPIQRGGSGPRCFGTDALKGGGYGFEIREHRSIGSLFSQILTDYASVLVNVGVCKDHDLSGVSAGCKNLYGLIHNPNRYHANRCDPFLADLLDHPAVRPKLRLTVIDAMEAQCNGGPAFSPTYLFRPGKILVSLDPVAVDVIAWEMIEEERARRGLPSLAEAEREPTWIAAAARLGLGEANRERITLCEVEG